MDRRKFLVGIAGIVGVAASSAADAATQPDLNYFPNGISKPGPHYVYTDILGERVELTQWDDIDGSSVRIWWRSHQSPRQTYALSFRGTFQDADKVETLRLAMQRTIIKINRDTSALILPADIPRGLCAPMKPEGCSTPLM